MRFEATDLSAGSADRVLFAEVGFALEPGETVSIRGASGAGKTLLLRQLAWLDPLRSGAVRLGGVRPEQMGVPRWRKRVTYVAQETPAFDGSANTLFGLAQRLETWDDVDDPRALAESWGVEGAAWSAPFARLSGGERQRIYLAIVLASGPDVLLLDEPTSHLDSAARDAVEKSLRGKTCVWVTHDAAQAERVGARSLQLGGRRSES